MGTEALWVPLAMTALAGGAQYYNTQQTANRQDNTLAASLRQEGQLQDQANAKTSQLIQDTAKSSPTAAKTGLLDQFHQQMLANQGSSTNSLNQAGDTSAAYKKAATDAALGISQYGNTSANNIASIDAPGLQRQGEAQNMMKFGTQVGQLKQQSAADNFLAQMRLRAIRPNPWVSAASEAAGAYSRYGGGGYGAAAGSGASAVGDGTGAVTSTGYNLPFASA